MQKGSLLKGSLFEITFPYRLHLWSWRPLKHHQDHLKNIPAYKVRKVGGLFSFSPSRGCLEGSYSILVKGLFGKHWVLKKAKIGEDRDKLFLPTKPCKEALKKPIKHSKNWIPLTRFP